MDRNTIPIPSTGKTAKRKRDQNKDSTKYPQGYFNNKPCKSCKEEFTPNAPSEHYCSDSCKDEALADRYLYRNYGISLEDYKDMYMEQDGKCKICKGSGKRRVSHDHSMPLVIDHDHSTLKVRGLLCHTCNSALGQFNDDTALLTEAIKYLTKPDLIFTKTGEDRTVGTRASNISKETHLNILIDHLDNNLNRQELIAKYSLSEARIRGIIEVKTSHAKKAYNRYLNLKKCNDYP